MIKSILISGVASYTEAAQISGLSRHNFFFGPNGSGKTTISRIIADETTYPGCQIRWDGSVKLETMVYSRDFVDKNLNPDSELKGIFTLGEKDESVVKKIVETKREIDTWEEDVKKLRASLNGEDVAKGKRAELEELEEQYEEKFWDLKLKFDEEFKDAFTGYRADKTKFKTKIISEIQNNKNPLPKLDELIAKAKTVLGTAPEKENEISTFAYDDLVALELHDILTKSVIGSGDVDLAALIQHLGNSDWVKEGRAYLPHSDDKCPFCQQMLPETFEDDLATYFDEAYETDIKTIKQLGEDYQQQAQSATEKIEAIIDSSSSFIDNAELESYKSIVDSKMALNKQRIATKSKESSKIITLESLQSTLDSVAEMIKGANGEIKAHNKTVDNLGKEKDLLTQQIWRYIVEEASSDYKSYTNEKANLNKAIEGLTQSISIKEKNIREKNVQISQLEKSITSIQPTIDGINRLLQSFDFTGFSLVMAEKKGYYKIIREDGSDAKETLSEGERSFVAFLYFYHALKGSENESGLMENRIVVFDDPVSSLDSHILFIVSNLIKGIFNEIRNNTGNIKQVFVLTHNVYFHKEVTYNPRRSGQALNEETFWIVRKDNNKSQVIKHGDNPIKTSYELLWNEVKSPNRSKITIQNTLRRILENYFRILGNINTDVFVDKFSGKDKIICRSLFSWVNDGSHYVGDDLDASFTEASTESYLSIFKNIFINEGQEAHYNMMMGITESRSPSEAADSQDQVPSP